MCPDKFLSVGMDPQKCSPVDAITLSKPLITALCVILHPRGASRTLRPTLGLSAANFTYASVKG